MKSRDLALVAILLAIGAVLNAFMPNLGVITPDTVVTFSALAILLIVPKPGAGLGIGIVAGVLAMFFSKSSIAWFNIPAHAIGALLATLVAALPTDLKIGAVPFKPALGSAAYGAIGGGIFITGMLVAQNLPLPGIPDRRMDPGLAIYAVQRHHLHDPLSSGKSPSGTEQLA